MLEKILRTLRKMLVDSETDAVLRGDSATTLFSHELDSSDVGYLSVTMPEAHGLLVEYKADMVLPATIESYLNPTHTGGTPFPMRNRYLGADASKFFDVIKDPAVTDPGTLLTSVSYGIAKTAGAETETSWFFIPAGVTILFKYTSNADLNIVVTRINAMLVPGLHEHE